MTRFLLALLAVVSCLGGATAQRSLQDLQQKFVTESRQLGGDATRQQRADLLARHTKELAAFVANDAKADDRWNGRLMLADLQLANGDRDAATAALRGIDAKQAPALLLVTAATMAQHLGMREQRDEWIRSALEKDAPLQDRLAMARMLTTVLREVDRGEGLFAAALAAATTDEDKAFVRWHRYDALRDREDLAENAAFDELQKLANDLPKTYWGSVAKDRVRRLSMKVGDEALPIRATTLENGDVTPESLAGKTVVLLFWESGDINLPKVLELLQQLQKRCGEKLVILGIGLDRDPQQIAAAKARLGMNFPIVGDGKGVLTDLALRWAVEGPVVHVVDANGKMAGLGMHAGTADGRATLLEIVERSCGS